MPNQVSGQGNGYAKLLVLGDFPDASSDKELEPFQEAAGSFLIEYLQR